MIGNLIQRRGRGGAEGVGVWGMGEDSVIRPPCGGAVTEDFRATGRLISGFSELRGPSPANPKAVYPWPGLA